MTTHTLDWSSICLSGVVAFATAAILVLTQGWHGRFSMDGLSGVQKMHRTPTPRIGGVALMFGLIAALGAQMRGRGGDPFNEDVMLMLQMLVASLPCFGFGMAEDITKRISVRTRLWATIGSGVLAWWLTDYHLTHANTWGLDWLLLWLPFSVLFTAFCVGGIANAVNIVDGFNGLSSGTLVLCFGTVALVALQVDDPVLAQIALTLAAVMLGFGAMNFPWGKIFLGDGGAYLAGFLLAWLTVMLPMRNEGVSVWTGVLICGYPSIEVFASIWRRHKRDGHHPGQPDKAHLHHLIYGRIARRWFKGYSQPFQNGMTSPPLWAYCALPCACALLFYHSTALLVLSFALCAAVYHLVYVRVVRFGWRLS
ncbi:MraY family glycosyltransferase [Amphibiibacter pelophylacis]|uniref:Glycosyltransferase n=1 Tax=Amphibiibacter pelophylacis TaxID=1799477 RepID=A0ACC6P200_9BURK